MPADLKLDLAQLSTSPADLGPRRRRTHLHPRAARRRRDSGPRQLHRRGHQPRQPDPPGPPALGRRRRERSAQPGRRRPRRPKTPCARTCSRWRSRRSPSRPRLELVPVAVGSGNRLSPRLGRLLQDRGRPRQLGRSRRRDHGHAALLPGPQPVRRRTDHRRRLSGQQRPAPARRHRAGRLADALRRLHDRRRQALHRHRRQHGLHPGLDLDRAQRHLPEDAGLLRQRSTRPAPTASTSDRDRRRKPRTAWCPWATRPATRSPAVPASTSSTASPSRRAATSTPGSARRRLGARPADGEHEHPERVQRVLGRLGGQLLPFGARRGLRATRARSPRSSTTSGATAWTTTARTPTSRGPARRSPTSTPALRLNTSCIGRGFFTRRHLRRLRRRLRRHAGQRLHGRPRHQLPQPPLRRAAHDHAGSRTASRTASAPARAALRPARRKAPSAPAAVRPTARATSWRRPGGTS